MFVRSGNRPARRLPAAQKTCLGGQHYLPPMGFSISLASIPRSDTPRRNEISRFANAQKEPTTAHLVQLPALMPWRRNRLVLKPNRYGGQRRSLSPEAFSYASFLRRRGKVNAMTAATSIVTPTMPKELPTTPVALKRNPRFAKQVCHPVVLPGHLDVYEKCPRGFLELGKVNHGGEPLSFLRRRTSFTPLRVK